MLSYFLPINAIFKQIMLLNTHIIEKITMDSIDLKILDILQRDCTIAIQDIAERINLSTSPCWKRIKRMEEQGIIKSRVALLDGSQINLGISVFVHIKTLRHDNAWLTSFSERILSFDEVVDCYRMSGEWDYLLRVAVKDIHAFDTFYKKLIKDIDGLSNVSSSFAMEEIKHTTCLPIDVGTL